MSKYVYPAIFTQEENNAFSVFFPDLEGCYTCGENLKDAITMAEDVLAFTLYDYETEGKLIPKASERKKIITEDNEFINYISCDTIEYARMHNNKAVKKTLTIPAWLNDMASSENINFSKILQDALMSRLGVNR